MIKFSEVSKIFKTDFYARPFTALDCFSFDIPNNQIVGFLGANGAGKTTSIKILMGFIKSNSGKIEFDSALGNSRAQILGNIGYLPERPYFYPHLTGREFINYMGKLNELSSKQIDKEMKRWTERFSIDFALDRKVRDYSKGMLQRLGFVVTLLHDPKLLILDEPLAGLDPTGRKELKDAIIEVHREGKTVFFSSHIVPDVEEICETVIFIEKGKLLYQGSIDKLILENLQSSFVVKTDRELDIEELQGKYVIENIVATDKTFSFEIGKEHKENCLKSLIDDGRQIYSVSQNKLSLEEIFYKVKNKERDILNEYSK